MADFDKDEDRRMAIVWAENKSAWTIASMYEMAAARYILATANDDRDARIAALTKERDEARAKAGDEELRCWLKVLSDHDIEAVGGTGVAELRQAVLLLAKRALGES